VTTKTLEQVRDDPFHIFVNSVRDYAIFMIDPKGYVKTWNSGAERIKGYTAAEIVGKHFSIFYPEEDVRSNKPQRPLDAAAAVGRIEDEGWRVRKDGSKFWADVVLTAIRDESGELLGFGKVVRDLSERRRVEDALRRSEERSRLFVEAVKDYAIFMLDTSGHVASWNVGAERIKGYKAWEIMGQHFSRFYPEEDIKNGKPQMELEVAAKVGRFEDEGWRLRKDGSKFWANVVITPVRDSAGKLVGFTKVTRDFTERMLAQKALESSQNSLRELSLHLLRTQDEERRAIGREMHDSLGQYLSVLKMRLDALSGHEERGEPIPRRELDECSKLVDECVKEVRTVSYLLYPPMLEEMGLKSAISWYLDGLAQRSGITVTFDAPEEFDRLSRDTELVLFRVLQECLTNVHKHSGSKTARVSLRRADGNVVLEIADSGKGFPAAALGDSRDWKGSVGVGLRGMSERLNQLGGYLHVSSDKTGTHVRAIVPAEKQPTDT
jgi:PAS domain S-box-containing protein